MSMTREIDLEQDGPVLSVWLNRPEVRNAFTPTMIAALRECFTGPACASSVRVVLLGGEGGVFCAGADLEWMQASARMSTQENYTDALGLAQMLAALDACPCPVVCRVQRAAVGGALGLMACCDSVICTSDSVFAFGEVRLGISPATIAPYVINKIGPSHARDLFLSGERFNAERAFSMGLVHAIVKPGELDEVIESKIDELLLAGPSAARATKALVRNLSPQLAPAMQEQTAQLIADLRVSAEGQEGLAAFLSKRDPTWLA
jgi:methylglutaconyl-CoA hydratase